eukprot:6205552-Pleurochrysis_carterae.AAC.5
MTYTGTDRTPDAFCGALQIERWIRTQSARALCTPFARRCASSNHTRTRTVRTLASVSGPARTALAQWLTLIACARRLWERGSALQQGGGCAPLRLWLCVGTLVWRDGLLHAGGAVFAAADAGEAG